MLCVTVLCAQELSSTFGSELKGGESVWLRPRQPEALQKFQCRGPQLIMRVMAQLDKKEESGRRQQQATGEEDRQTTNEVAAAAGCNTGTEDQQTAK